MAIDKEYWDRAIPEIAKSLLSDEKVQIRAWIVGSAADRLIRSMEGHPNDVDMIVHPDDFSEALRQLARMDSVQNRKIGITLTNHGGLRVFPRMAGSGLEREIDIWPDTPAEYILRCHQQRNQPHDLAINPYTNEYINGA
jgi:hypothetical protein